MTWEPCPGCRAPVWTEPDGTVIGLSAKVHHCLGPVPEVMECHCGEVVWVIEGVKHDPDGRVHKERPRL